MKASESLEDRAATTQTLTTNRALKTEKIHPMATTTRGNSVLQDMSLTPSDCSHPNDETIGKKCLL
jgi:hypothetical protein